MSLIFFLLGDSTLLLLSFILKTGLLFFQALSLELSLVLKALSFLLGFLLKPLSLELRLVFKALAF